MSIIPRGCSAIIVAIALLRWLCARLRRPRPGSRQEERHKKPDDSEADHEPNRVVESGSRRILHPGSCQGRKLAQCGEATARPGNSTECCRVDMHAGLEEGGEQCNSEGAGRALN